ncbi:MAG: T9SS type A sorting domain-containing protein [Bacteroidota bacterium]
MKFILQSLICLCLSVTFGFSQVIEVPPSENLTLKLYYQKHGDTKPLYAAKSGLNNSLPFIEDFTAPGPFPDPVVWENNQVYINYGMGQAPPSYGVATFDGLNASGIPYGGGYGGSDTLTSRVFDLSGNSSADDIWLSYFIQAKGLGERPEVADVLILEFMSNSGNWVQIEQHAGLTGGSPDFIPDFSQHFHPVTDNAYLHSNFQFRFRNLSSNSGFLDIWNLDYIEMAENRSGNETSFDDIACVTLPPDVLLTYTAMPFDQFLGDIPGELQLSAAMEITNHFSTGKSVDPREISAYETTSGAMVLPSKNFGQTNFTPGQTLSLNENLSFNDFNFGVLPTSTENAEIVTEYSFQINGQNQGAELNDIARTTTHFKDYFAYDDGTAESNIVATGQGTQVAVMFHVNVPDTIQAIQIHFQRVQGSVVDQEFNLFVWKDNLDSDPVLDLIFENPSYVDTINGFTQYNFDEPVFLDSGDDFFIGWQQFTQTSNSIPVGFDKNNPDANQFAYQNVGSGWSPLSSSLQGAIMLRPIMGFDLFVSNEEIITPDDHIEIFPNPVSEVLNLNLLQGNFSDYRYEIFDATGRLSGQGALTEHIRVDYLVNGLHILQITQTSTNQVMHHKLVKID